MCNLIPSLLSDRETATLVEDFQTAGEQMARSEGKEWELLAFVRGEISAELERRGEAGVLYAEEGLCVNCLSNLNSAGACPECTDEG